MRIESAVTAVSWIPSDIVAGYAKLPFSVRAMHFDPPPPDHIDDIAALYAGERFRFANVLAAWIDVEGGRVVDSGYSGRSYISRTHVTLPLGLGIVFQPAGFPELRGAPQVRDGEVRFVQTNGGRPGMPVPRPVTGSPHVQWMAPTVWTTLSLTVRTDGSSHGELIGSSTFPRHWIYDAHGDLMSKSAATDSIEWFHSAFGPHTPWGGENSEPLVTAAETALERELASAIMRGGARPTIERLTKGQTLVEQGTPGAEIYLLLDGVMGVFVNGEQLAEVGPGAVMGERALLEGGHRTATLRARTHCVVASARANQIDTDALRQLARQHRREGSAANA
ncbi:MAG: cyclic nucleotide-binding domain-containing protein [Candidatus Dormibacteraeota bacterium]|nr:cyclic nucleotide-binding domain-containing protein [Candidatus Dormibacteraeota bacterium]